MPDGAKNEAKNAMNYGAAFSVVLMLNDRQSAI
jgi:hypothetical protein